MAETGRAQNVDPGLVAEIVRSYVAKNSVAADQLGNLIATVQRALSRLGKKPGSGRLVLPRRLSARSRRNQISELVGSDTVFGDITANDSATKPGSTF